MATAARPSSESTALEPGAPGGHRPEQLQRLVDEIDWDQAKADTRYLSHDLHRYSGKFIPQVARSAIGLLTRPGDLVVDPYVGSGTTLLEAALTGRRAHGIDLNPVAIRIATAKTTPISERGLARMSETLGGIAATLVEDGTATLESLDQDFLLTDAISDPRRSDPWFEKWFEPQILVDLLVFDHAVRRLGNRAQRTLGEVVLSDVLRRSSRAHGGYPNVMFDRNAAPRPRPGQLLLSSLRRCIDAVSVLPPLSGIEVGRGDANAFPIEDGTADAVVTHPPYIGSIPYAEYGLLSLMWFGDDPKALDRALTGGRRQSRDVVDRFVTSYAGGIREMHRILRRGGTMFMLVGRPVVRGELIDLPGITADLAKQAGFELLAEASRQGSNRRANKMGAEMLLFFGKA